MRVLQPLRAATMRIDSPKAESIHYDLFEVIVRMTGQDGIEGVIEERLNEGISVDGNSNYQPKDEVQ